MVCHSVTKLNIPMEALCLMPTGKRHIIYNWIDSDAELARAVASWSPVIGLIQVYSHEYVLSDSRTLSGRFGR